MQNVCGDSSEKFREYPNCPDKLVPAETLDRFFYLFASSCGYIALYEEMKGSTDFTQSPQKRLCTAMDEIVLLLHAHRMSPGALEAFKAKIEEGRKSHIT